MKSIAAGTFKTHCLAIMENVRSTRSAVVITKRGRPIAKLVPVEASRDAFIGRLVGVIKIVGDIESPIEPPENWEALR